MAAVAFRPFAPLHSVRWLVSRREKFMTHGKSAVSLRSGFHFGSRSCLAYFFAQTPCRWRAGPRDLGRSRGCEEMMEVWVESRNECPSLQQRENFPTRPDSCPLLRLLRRLIFSPVLLLERLEQAREMIVGHRQ